MASRSRTRSEPTAVAFPSWWWSCPRKPVPTLSRHHPDPAVSVAISVFFGYLSRGQAASRSSGVKILLHDQLCGLSGCHRTVTGPQEVDAAHGVCAGLADAPCRLRHPRRPRGPLRARTRPEGTGWSLSGSFFDRIRLLGFLAAREGVPPAGSHSQPAHRGVPRREPRRRFVLRPRRSLGRGCAGDPLRHLRRARRDGGAGPRHGFGCGRAHRRRRRSIRGNRDLRGHRRLLPDLPARLLACARFAGRRPPRLVCQGERRDQRHRRTDGRDESRRAGHVPRHRRACRATRLVVAGALGIGAALPPPSRHPRAHRGDGERDGSAEVPLHPPRAAQAGRPRPRAADRSAPRMDEPRHGGFGDRHGDRVRHVHPPRRHRGRLHGDAPRARRAPRRDHQFHRQQALDLPYWRGLGLARGPPVRSHLAHLAIAEYPRRRPPHRRAALESAARRRRGRHAGRRGMEPSPAPPLRLPAEPQAQARAPRGAGLGDGRRGLAPLGGWAAATAAVAVLFVAYGMPSAEESVHGFSIHADDAAPSGSASFLPKLRPEAFYSESYSFLFSAEDGTFVRVQFLVSNGGLEARGKAAARAVMVLPDGSTVEDADTFDPEQWNVLSEGAIEMGAHRLTMGPDASHHVHFGGKKLVVDATVLPETTPLRPGGGRVVFDASGRAVFDQTIFALRSRFDGSVWSPRRGNKRVKGYCYADTSYSTVPACKSASLWLRMEAFGDGSAGTAALAVLFPPQGTLRQPEGWLYTSKNGKTEVRSSEVKVAFEDLRHEPGGRFEYDVPQRIIAVARGAEDERVTLTLQARRLLYKEDVLGEMEPLSRLLVSTVAAPRAHTHEDAYTLRSERKGEPAEVRSGTALTEFSHANKPSQLAAAF